MKKKIAFMIRDLNYGGAQRQLIALAKALDKTRFEVTVLCFYANGLLEPDLQAHQIPVICFAKRSRWDVFGFLWQMLQHLQQLRPDVLHGYLSESNLLTIGFKPFLPKTRIIWGIRDSNMSLDSFDWLDRLIFDLECWFSRFVDLIIVNSHAGRDYHLTHGFPHHKMVVVPNGIDIDRFQPDRAAGAKVRAEWQIADSTTLIGLIGRLDPMKDHPNFLKAAALLAKERSDVRFVCVGNGPEDYGHTLAQLAQELGIADRMIWAGGRRDMPAVYNALDVVCSASAYGEGFANVIGEAMACGVPCVATDVGDAAWIIGELGPVVPPQDPVALCQGLLRSLATLPARDNAPNPMRQRIVTHFSVPQLSQNTQRVLL